MHERDTYPHEHDEELLVRDVLRAAGLQVDVDLSRLVRPDQASAGAHAETLRIRRLHLKTPTTTIIFTD